MPESKSPCAGCIYYGKSTNSCDYILIADQRRPCPPGAECTVRRTSKEVKKMGKPRWDTELGRLLWLEGKSDAQIAKEMGVAPNTVLHQRRKWEKTTKRPEPAAAEAALEHAPELTPELIPEEKESPKPAPVSMSTPENVYNILEEATKTKKRYRSHMHCRCNPLSLELGQRRRSASSKGCHQPFNQTVGGLSA